MAVADDSPSSLGTPSYWETAGVAVLPAHEVSVLEDAITREDCATARLTVSRLQETGALPYKHAEDGAPIDARVAYGEVPRFLPHSGGRGLDFAVVTTEDVQDAFATLSHGSWSELRRTMEPSSGGVAGNARDEAAGRNGHPDGAGKGGGASGGAGSGAGSVAGSGAGDAVAGAWPREAGSVQPEDVSADLLRRAVTCSLLQRLPLSSAQTDAMLRTVGVDGQGRVSPGRFSDRLSVLPPMPPPPPKPGYLSRVCGACCCCPGVCCCPPWPRERGEGEQRMRPDDDLDDDDGASNSDAGLRPIHRVHNL